MQGPHLEVTFRHGKPFAACYYLPRGRGQASYRTVELEAGILIDYSRGGRPLRIKLTSPRNLTLAAMNRVLIGLGMRRMTRQEIAPLVIA